MQYLLLLLLNKNNPQKQSTKTKYNTQKQTTKKISIILTLGAQTPNLLNLIIINYASNQLKHFTEDAIPKFLIGKIFRLKTKLIRETPNKRIICAHNT